jgi:hypothetical protein
MGTGSRPNSSSMCAAPEAAIDLIQCSGSVAVCAHVGQGSPTRLGQAVVDCTVLVLGPLLRFAIHQHSEGKQR